MQINSYIILREKQSSILVVEDNKLFMKRTDKEELYLTSRDGYYGVIHDDEKIYAFVEIGQTDSGSYILKDLDNHLYFWSRPLGDNNHRSVFASNRVKALSHEEFDLRSILLENKDIYINFLNALEVFKDEKVVNLYWWRSLNFINFGDELNPHIISYLTNKKIKKVTEADTDLIGIGSILNRFPKRQKPYEVWGTGTLCPSEIKGKDHFKVSLLRGPLTKSLFDKDLHVPFGDPGILASIVWSENPQKIYDWGLIVHYSQAYKPWVKKLIDKTPNSILINVKNSNLAELMSQISSCKNIASTSLHGLIIADSYCIPNIWIWDDNIHMGGQWKFFDYFSGIDRYYIDNVNPLKINSLSEIKLENANFKYFSQIENVQSRVIKSFPLK